MVDVNTLAWQLKLIGADFRPHDNSDLVQSLELCVRRCRDSAAEITQARNRLEGLCLRSKRRGPSTVAVKDAQL